VASRFDPLGVRALVFDVFGTVVDWRGSIIAEGERYWRPRGLDIDWPSFADAWRAAYGPSMDRVRRGELPWTKLDALHRVALDRLLADFGITGLSQTEVDHLNRVWHRLDAWPDAPAGLARLKSRYVIATLSNGNVSLLTEMAKFAGLPWDAVLGADLFHHYKPDPEVYLGAAALLDLAPAQLMMVACPHRRPRCGSQARSPDSLRPPAPGTGTRPRTAPSPGRRLRCHRCGLPRLGGAIGPLRLSAWQSGLPRAGVGPAATART